MSDAANGHPREHLSAYLDDELDVEERASVDRHLAECEDCRSELTALVQLANAVADEAVPPVPADLVVRIGRRLDAATILRPRRFRFVVPTTIAATIAAIGIMVALQWRERPPGMPVEPERRAKSMARDEIRSGDAPALAAPVPQATAPPGDDRGKNKELLEKDAERSAEPGVVPSAQPELRPNEEVAGGVVGGVAGGVSGGVEGGADAGERKLSAAMERPDRVMRDAPASPAPVGRPSAAKSEAISPCADRWSDSGVRGTWIVPDPGGAARELDRIARDVGGVGTWRGVADGRPYVLAVPRPRFEEVFFALRARGVAGLVEPPVLADGSDCAGLSIALSVVDPPTAPPP